MAHKAKWFLIVSILWTSFFAAVQAASITPRPQSLTAQPGQFIINADTQIIVAPSNAKAHPVAAYLEAFLATPTDWNLTVTDKPSTANAIVLHLDSTADTPESYTLKVTPQCIDMHASDPAGLFYAAQTLRQLLPTAIEFDVPIEGVEWTVPCVEITDAPRYGWRGLMLDESRHFFGKEAVLDLLDRMALYKLNRFHWHLTDEPGWRVEIMQYPRLTEIGSVGNCSDPDAPARFYTQQDIREVIAYAAARNIVVIPEIDMPGHATAANRAYPEYSGGGSERLPDFTFNPGKEKTYSYLNDILGEIADLFPGPWLHYGGDEVHFGNQQWACNPDVQAMMEKEGLKDIRQMEHYFNRRMSDSIKQLGKTTIGWDEIVDAGVPAEQAVVMWWRHDKPKQLIKALGAGYRTVLCPRRPCYFDFVQHDSHKWGRRWDGGFNTVESVYVYPVLPKDVTPQQEKLVLGLQGNLWTETVANRTRMEFMIHPRLAALAEAAWTKADQKDWGNFKSRLPGLFKRHEILGDTYFNCLDPAATPEPKGVKKK